MPNLLSCPFCGEADVLIIEAEDDDGQFAAVGCNGCGAGSRQHYYCGEDAKEYAADAWNRRATLSDAPTEPVGAVNGEEQPEWSSPELERLACEAQQGYQNPVAQVAFRAGFLLCREYMARFVEQGGDTNTAASIRANWIPAFGADPGPPRKYDFAEVAEAEDMDNGPWRSKNPGPSVDAAVYALKVMAALGMQLPPEAEAALRASAQKEAGNG